MAHGVIRGLFGGCRSPILAFLAGVGFFMPVGVVRSVPAAAEAIRSGGDAPSVLVGARVLPSAVIEPVSGRGPGSGAGSPRRGEAAPRVPIPSPSTSSAPTGEGPEAAALARLARAGRLSAPTTAPPPIPS